MSLTRTLARRLAIAALVLAAIAGAMIALLVATAEGAAYEPVRAAAAPAAVEVAPAMVAVEAPYVPVDAFLVTLLGETDLPAGQAEAFDLAADRVCEGHTAEVPVAVLVDTVGQEFGLTVEESVRFVDTASAIRCTVAP